MSSRRIASALIAAAVTAVMLWAYGTHPRRGAGRREPVPIQDGKTIDFSNGSPAVADGAADKAALDAGVKAIDEATKDVTIPADPPKK